MQSIPIHRLMVAASTKGQARPVSPKTDFGDRDEYRVTPSGMGGRVGLKTGRKSPDDKFLHDVGEGGFAKPDQGVLHDQSHGIAIA